MRSGHKAGKRASTFVTITDSFTRADSAITLSSTEGTNIKAWSAFSGGWGVSVNQAYTPTGAIDAVAVVDAGVSDCTVTLTIRTVVGSQGVAFRWVDANNGYRTAFFSGNLDLKKFVAGVGTDVPGSPVALAPVDGDVMSVILSGNSIIVKVNGVQKFSITDAQFQSATKHGMAQAGFGDVTMRYDNFSITVP